MSRKVVKPRNPWEERFQAPEAGDLLDAMPKYLAVLVERAREGLRSLDGAAESIVWRGVPWRWTFTFADESEPERVWAYLVPRPDKPILSIPLTHELVQALPMKRLSKPVRDGIALAAQVGGVYWPQWELGSKTQIDELIEIARKRRDGALTATV